MTDRPISIVEPQIAQLVAGRLSALRRPITMLYSGIKPGDRFWVREPFHLDARWNGLAPSAAARLYGVKPVFATDVDLRDPRLGKRQFARCLLRTWHRQHLVVQAIERGRLQAISQAEIEAEGFLTRAGYAAAWDRNLSLAMSAANWARDPDVIIIRFRRVAKPLPGDRPS